MRLYSEVAKDIGQVNLIAFNPLVFLKDLEVEVIARVAIYIKVAGELDMQGLEVLDLQVKAIRWAKLVLEAK